MPMKNALVPTVDVSRLLGSDPNRRSEAAQEIHDALRGSGFFYASNHGIDVDSLQEIVWDFHHSITAREKHDLAIRAYNPRNPHIRNGYYEAIPGRKAVESWCYLNPRFTPTHPAIEAGLPMHECNIWPTEARFGGFRRFAEEYFYRVHALSVEIMAAIALSIGLPERYFDKFFDIDDTLSAVSMIKYPHLDEYPPVKVGPDGTKLSFEDHLDVSLLTVLFQTPVANLQVETESGWQDVPTSGSDFLINVGSAIPYITQGYFEAPLHRVVYHNTERLSIPFFFHAGFDSEMPIVSVSRNEPKSVTIGGAQGDWLNYGEYLSREFHALIRKNGQT